MSVRVWMSVCVFVCVCVVERVCGGGVRVCVGGGGESV